ncbi:MAG: cytochrome c oxidase subunit II [Phycisphaeraceae bacterium]
MHWLLAQVDEDGTFWMPGQYSTYAGESDWTFYFILYISIFFTVLVASLVVWFAIRNRAKDDPGRPGKGPAHNTALEMTWTIIPLLLVLAIFLYGFRGFVNMATPEAGSYEIVVVSQKWNWIFEYPNGAESPHLHVPADRPVTLVLTSRDVIHSFYVPAFRAKKDAVPGRYNRTWFEAVWRPGAVQTEEFNGEPYEVIEHDLYCAEYCGTGHSQMLAKVYVHQPDDFDRWVQQQAQAGSDLTPVQQGERLVAQHCAACHNVDGTRAIGPPLDQVYGETREVRVDGELTEVEGDEEYIRNSIYNPQAAISSGYPDAMNTFQGVLDEDELRSIIAYLKAISPNAPEPAAEEAAEEQPAEGEDEAEAAESPEVPESREPEPEPGEGPAL